MPQLPKSAEKQEGRNSFISFNYENRSKNWKPLQQNVALVTSYQTIYLNQNLRLKTFYQDQNRLLYTV